MPANDTQIGGDHYKGAKCPECGTSIEHWDLAWLFKWDNFQYAITKYVMRWRSKHGVEDLRKAQHCLEKYIEVVLRDEGELKTNDRDEDGARGIEVDNSRGGGYVRVRSMRTLDFLNGRAYDSDGNEYALVPVDRSTFRFETTETGISYERPSPDLDASGEPGPGYANQDPDLPLKGPRWPDREPGETPETEDPGG